MKIFMNLMHANEVLSLQNNIKIKNQQQMRRNVCKNYGERPIPFNV